MLLRKNSLKEARMLLEVFFPLKVNQLIRLLGY